MDYKSYINLFEEILNNRSSDPRYNDPKYSNYAKLNYSRMNRWQKTLQLNEKLVAEIKKINQPQKWIIITEHWCGDAAPALPLIMLLAAQNSLVQCDLRLRDQEPFLINSYLTNGTKSIPKLIVQDAAGNDLFTWGPRPAAAQKLISDLKMSGVSPEVVKAELQNWYNNNKGEEFQKELLQLFRRGELH